MRETHSICPLHVAQFGAGQAVMTHDAVVPMPGQARWKPLFWIKWVRLLESTHSFFNGQGERTETQPEPCAKSDTVV
jgi:hypothetical protein